MCAATATRSQSLTTAPTASLSMALLIGNNAAGNHS
jgi:hypothetical protein